MSTQPPQHRVNIDFTIVSLSLFFTTVAVEKRDLWSIMCCILTFLPSMIWRVFMSIATVSLTSLARAYWQLVCLVAFYISYICHILKRFSLFLCLILCLTFQQTLRPQGGSEGQKIKLTYSERSHWDEKDVEDRMKKYYSLPELWIYENRDSLVIAVRAKSLNRSPRKLPSMYLLERTTHPKVLKFGLWLPWVDIYKSDLGIWKILDFANFTLPVIS